MVLNQRLFCPPYPHQHPQGASVIAGDIFGCHNQRGWLLLLSSSIIHRKSPTIKNYLPWWRKFELNPLSIQAGELRVGWNCMNCSYGHWHFKTYTMENPQSYTFSNEQNIVSYFPSAVTFSVPPSMFLLQHLPDALKPIHHVSDGSLSCSWETTNWFINLDFTCLV